MSDVKTLSNSLNGKKIFSYKEIRTACGKEELHLTFLNGHHMSIFTESDGFGLRLSKTLFPDQSFKGVKFLDFNTIEALIVSIGELPSKNSMVSIRDIF